MDLVAQHPPPPNYDADSSPERFMVKARLTGTTSTEIIKNMHCSYTNARNLVRRLLLPPVGGYQHRLLNVVDDIHTKIEQRSWGEWNDVDE